MVSFLKSDRTACESEVFGSLRVFFVGLNSFRDVALMSVSNPLSSFRHLPLPAWMCWNVLCQNRQANLTRRVAEEVLICRFDCCTVQRCFFLSGLLKDRKQLFSRQLCFFWIPFFFFLNFSRKVSLFKWERAAIQLLNIPETLVLSGQF